MHNASILESETKYWQGSLSNTEGPGLGSFQSHMKHLGMV